MIGLYQSAFALHGDSPSAVLWPKGRQNVRFEALLRHLRTDECETLIDFGSGLGHLFAYLTRQGFRGNYVGIDCVPEFVQHCRAQYPSAAWHLASNLSDIAPGSCDYVVASGAFNINTSGSEQAHFDYVTEMITEMFATARISISVDFMRADVDYKQPGAFHMPISALVKWVSKSLSRHFVVDASYLPYEFCITVWHEPPTRIGEAIW